jgi:hypothetical protein
LTELAILEAAACQRGEEQHLVAAGAHLVHVAGQVGAEFADQVGGAARLARLVVVAELDQHPIALRRTFFAQQREHGVPQAFGAVALAAAPTARQVQAGQLLQAFAQGVAPAAARRHRGVADQDEARPR